MIYTDEHLSPSGVPIAADCRCNLMIDRYDPVFADMRAGKIEHLRSVNSEDAITWKVFRSLRKVDPTVWLCGLRIPIDCGAYRPRIYRCSTLGERRAAIGLLVDGDEGASEIDVIIESASWV